METHGKPGSLICNDGEEAQGNIIKPPVPNSNSAPVVARQQDTAWQLQSAGNFESGLQAEQCRLLYEGIPAALAINTLLALILAGVLWPVTAPGKLLTWLAMLATILLARAVLGVAWQRNGTNAANFSVRWLHRFRIATIVTGLTWGAGAVLLFPESDALHQLFLAFVLAGVSVAAVTLLAVDRVSVFGFLALMLIPLAASFAMEGNLISMAMDVMIALYLIFVAASAARAGRSFRENVRLRIEAGVREQALRMQNRELNSVAECSPDNIIRYNMDCRAQYVNHMMEKTVNVAAASLIGKTPIESKFDGLVGVENYQAKLQRVIDSGVREQSRSWCRIPVATCAPITFVLSPNAAVMGKLSAHWLLAVTSPKANRQRQKSVSPPPPSTPRRPC